MKGTEFRVHSSALYAASAAGQVVCSHLFRCRPSAAVFPRRREGQALIDETALYAGGRRFRRRSVALRRPRLFVRQCDGDRRKPDARALCRCARLSWTGVQHTPDDVFLAGLFRAARADLRVQVQCAGGAAIDKVLSMYETIDREIPIKGKRWAIEHCQFPTLENMATCVRLGVIATTTTNFLWNYDTVYLKCFGAEMSASSIPLRDWIDAGVMIAQSTDGRPYDPIFTFWQSLARKAVSPVMCSDFRSRRSHASKRCVLPLIMRLMPPSGKTGLDPSSQASSPISPFCPTTS